MELAIHKRNVGITVAIVGRPNVGKSSLFNLWTGTRRSLVFDTPGVTRDKIYGLANLDEARVYNIIDTGGFETDDLKFQPFENNEVWKKATSALEEADIIVLLFDALEGVHPHDRVLAAELRSFKKPLFWVVNKIDGMEKEYLSADFYQLGADQIYSISAAHKYGYNDFREALDLRVSELAEERAKSRASRSPEATYVSIIGRPNAGKSSILNRLLGEERAIVSEVAGTTRDTLDASLKYNNHEYIVVDTAGIRRKSKIDDKIESLSVLKSIQAVEDSQIVVLVIDAMQGFTEQDQRLGDLALSQHKAFMVVVNKWDLLVEKDSTTADRYAKEIQCALSAHRRFPVLFTSCLHNQRISKILVLVDELRQEYFKRTSTSKLNEALARIVDENTPALSRNKSRRTKFYFATQVAVAPPTIVVKCNVAGDVKEDYKRYMNHRFRDELGFENIPLRLIFRGKSEENSGVE